MMTKKKVYKISHKLLDCICNYVVGEDMESAITPRSSVIYNVEYKGEVLL